jgi:hypothetical protein
VELAWRAGLLKAAVVPAIVPTIVCITIQVFGSSGVQLGL